LRKPSAVPHVLNRSSRAHPDGWEEDWKVTPSGLQVVEARIQGSGAGMEPPEGAVLKAGWWVYAPDVGPQRSLMLAASGATGDGWRLCTVQGCRELGKEAGGSIRLEPCAPDGTSQQR
jgi:hypothetical protein